MPVNVLKAFIFPKKRFIIVFSSIIFLFFGNIFSAKGQAPPVITSFAPGTVCQGDAVTITGTNFTGATEVKLGSAIATNVTVVDATTITANVDLHATDGVVTVTTPDGTVVSTGILTIKPAPIPLLTDVNGLDAFTNCNGNSTYQLTVRNNSSNLTGNNTFKIDWGDNSASFSQLNWPAGSTTTHTFNAQGYFDIVLTITPENGCTKSTTFRFYNGQNPLASFTTTTSTTGLCSPASIEFQIGNWFNNSTGTSYVINFGDGTPKVTLSHPLNASGTIRLLSHIYTNTSCPASPDFTATLQAINGCFTTTYTLNQIIIRKKPVSDFTIPAAPVCINTPVCFTNTTISGFSGNSCVATSNFSWDFGDGTVSNLQTPPCHTYNAPGTYTVTLTALNPTCGNDIRTKSIIVLPTSPIPVVTTPVIYCRGNTAVPLSATGTNLLWYTTATGGTGSVVAPTPSTNTVGTFTWYVSQTLANSCESPRVPIAVTVNALPAAPAVTTPVQLCVNQTASALTATGTGLLWYNSASGGTGSSTAPIPNTTATGTFNYYVSQTTNTCEGPRAIIVVNVNPLASAPVVTPTITYCQNQAASQLTATPAGSLLWYTVATGGSGSPTAPTPSTSTVGTTIWYVSQVTGCGEGPRSSIAVTVNPGPSASITYSQANLCNVSNAIFPNPPVSAVLTGTPGGIYSILPATGLPINATTGELNPSGATPGTYTIRYSIAGSGGCAAFSTTTTININSTPSAIITYPAAVCTSTSATSVQLAGTQGGVFSSAAGLTINASTGMITPGTSVPGNYTITYTVAPSGPCPGFNTAANITITQAPSATIAYSITNLCNADSALFPNPSILVTQTGTTGGIYSISPSTGLPIDITTGKLTPSGAVAGNYIITYKIAGSGGCPDYTTTATVTVSGAPKATIKYPSPVCSSDATATVTRTGTTGGSYSSTAGLVIDPVTGTITPATSNPGKYFITYTIAPSAPCPGFIATDSIVITKAPSAAIIYNPVNICNVKDTASTPNPPIAVTQTGTGGGVYTISPATGLRIDPATGVLTPSLASPGVYTITYTIAAAEGCAVYKATTAVTVSAAPIASIKYPTPVCSSDAAAAVTRIGTAGGTYTSTAGLTINASTGTVSPATSTPGKYIITYTISASAPCPGYVTTDSIIITKAPLATIQYNPASLCNVVNTVLTPNPDIAVTLTGTNGGGYSIAPTTGLPIDAVTGTIKPSGATPGNYIITYSVLASAGCARYSTSTSVTVTAAPAATISYPASSYCRGISIAQPVIFLGTPGGVFSSTAGLSINASTGAINPAASSPGAYTVIYTIAASSPCPGYIASTIIQIDDSPVLTFSSSAQSVCSGGRAVYIPASTVANTTYTWALVGVLPANMAGIVSGTASGPNAAISLSFTNTGASSQTLTIQVKPVNPSQNPCPGVPYNISLTVNPIPAALPADTFRFCMATPSTALTVTPQTGNTIKWYDANLVLLNAAPVINTAVPATFTYYVSQANVYGCESPKTIMVAIVYPTAKIVSSSFVNPTTCGIPSGAVILNVLDLNNNPIPNIPLIVHYNKFQTAFQMPGSTDASGKITVPLTAGTYSGFYIETYGCLSQKIPDIFILKDPNPPAQPVAGYNPPICSETLLNLTALTPTSTLLGPINYVWAGPAFGALPDTTQNTVVSFASASMSYAGTYVVYAIQNNCISPTATFQVVIKESPSKPVISTRAPLCVGDDLVLQAYSSISGQNAVLNYSWSGPGTSFPVNAANAGIAKVKIQDAGIYTITVNSPQTGCSSTSDTLVLIGDYPKVKFARDTFTLPTGYLLKLVPLITNETDPGILPIKNFAWTPASDIACNDPVCSSPVATIKNNVCYSVKATNIYGCSGSDTLCVKVFCQGSQVFIPNAFTPTGNVPENTKLMVRASGISSVKSFRVFNRWGRIVFERNNFPPNSTDFGWDGRVNGKLADTGVYIYTVEVICENGIPYSYKGNVTLL